MRVGECASWYEQNKRMVVLDGWNARFRNLEVEKVIGEFAVPGVNCAGRGMV